MKSKRGCVISLWHALLFFFMFFALEAFLLRRLLTDLRGGDLFGRYRYPLRVEYVPQNSQIYTDFSWEVLVTQISQMTQIFFIGYFYSSDFTDLHRFFLLQFPSLPSLSSILISHLLFLTSHFIIPFYFFTFKKPFYLFTFLPLKKPLPKNREK